MHDNTAPDPWQPVKTVAVVLAGGTGERLGLGIPKQLLKVAGKPILEHTLTRLEAAPEIDEIVLLMAAGHVPAAERIVREAGLRKVTQVVEGGATRSATTQRALDLIGPEPCNLVIHDAVRPLLSHRIIRECVNALRQYAAVDVAIPSADTIIEVDANDCIRAIPPRAALRRGQTPQAFRSPVIREAYRLAMVDPDFAATDDCGVVLRYLPAVAIKVVEGAEENIKVTQPLDVHLADKLFQLSSHPAPVRDPRRLREELRGRTVVVFGGSYGIGQEVTTLARALGADVFPYSRSQTGTHVENPAEVAAALQAAHDKTGRIDYVVVTAGTLRHGPLAEASADDVEASLHVNFLAPVTIARAAFGYLANSQGHLVLYTSSSYTRGRAGYALYSATKAAIVNLTQALSDEWAAAGVRVNCINPERTATPMRTRAFGDEPVDSLLQPDIVAATTIDVLVSELTGQVIDVRRPD